MVTKRAPSPIWTVSIPVPDEHEGDILATTDDHAQITYGACAELKIFARRTGCAWLVRGETQILYPRSTGTIGSFYPDVLVAHDVELPGTDPYRILQVGRSPELVMEVLSKETAKNDLGDKRVAYAQMGVREYVTFDPRPRKKLSLVAHRLLGRGQYVLLDLHPRGGFWLETIGLRVVAEPPDRATGRGPRLRFFTADEQPLLHVEEEAETRLAAQEAHERAEQERLAEQRARRHAERERAALAAENERLRALLAAHGLDRDAR